MVPRDQAIHYKPCGLWFNMTESADMILDPKKIFFLKLGLGIGAFAAVINLLDWHAIWDVARQLTLFSMVLVLISILSEFPFLAWRWHLIVRDESSRPAR